MAYGMLMITCASAGREGRERDPDLVEQDQQRYSQDDIRDHQRHRRHRQEDARVPAV